MMNTAPLARTGLMPRPRPMSSASIRIQGSRVRRIPARILRRPTPNPDVLCNAEIKFKAFLDHALRLGAQRIATGHYARVRQADHTRRQGAKQISHGDDAQAPCLDHRFELLRGIDESKDQSYFLHRLNQSQLARTVFPLGDLRKTEVRRIAAEIGLPNAAKRDSTGICFIGERPFREFLNRYLPAKPGPIKSSDGRVLGEHVGLAFYTLGQRKGIGIGGVNARDGGDASGAPWFVARKDMVTDTLWIVQGHDHPWLLSDRLIADDVVWVAGAPPAIGTRLTAKTRYRQGDAQCTIIGISGRGFELSFEQPQWAVTPGQSAVLYHREACLGGGVIASVSSARAESVLPTSSDREYSPQ